MDGKGRKWRQAARECQACESREAFGVRAACCRFRRSWVFDSGSKLRALQTLRAFGCAFAALWRMSVEMHRNVAYGDIRPFGPDMDEPGHILVAEDSAVDAFFLQRAFNRAGMAVSLHVVRDGQEVVDYLEGTGQFHDRRVHPLPRLLLLDLHMPRLNGFEVLRWLRQQPRFHGLEVVIFTSSDEPKDVNRALGLGANAYLVKPHSIDELNALVGRFKKSWVESGRVAHKKAA